jgi:hypothetical protein
MVKTNDISKFFVDALSQFKMKKHKKLRMKYMGLKECRIPETMQSGINFIADPIIVNSLKNKDLPTYSCPKCKFQIGRGHREMKAYCDGEEITFVDIGKGKMWKGKIMNVKPLGVEEEKFFDKCFDMTAHRNHGFPIDFQEYEISKNRIKEEKG